MRWAESLQSLKVHFSFLGGMPPRIGSAMCRVEDGGSREEIGVVDGDVVEVRCLPAWTRRMEVVGAEVRRERRCRRVGIVVSEGTVSGMAWWEISFGILGFEGLGDILSPESSLTKIWKLSGDGDEDVDEDVDVEEAFDDERDGRMLGDLSWRLWMRRYVCSTR